MRCCPWLLMVRLRFVFKIFTIFDLGARAGSSFSAVLPLGAGPSLRRNVACEMRQMVAGQNLSITIHMEY